MTSPRHRFSYPFSHALLRAAMRRDVLWRGYLVAGFFLLFPFALRGLEGAWNPLLTVAFLLGGVFAVFWTRRTLNTMATRLFDYWSTQSPSGTVEFVLDDDGFSVEFERSSSRHAWNEMRRLWRYPDVWLLEVVQLQSVFFPPDQVPEDARRFVETKLAEAGVTIKP